MTYEHFLEEYRRKLRTPEEAVSVVKDGDWVDYTCSLGKPEILDRALAKRRDELFDVKIRGNLISGPIAVAECDESQEHFTYHSWHCSAYERSLCDRGLCYYIPMVFHNNAAYYEYFLKVNVVMLSVSPMDRHGYFNYSVNTGVAAPIVRAADIVIVEINENLPKVRGGYDECIHISDIDYIVEETKKILAIDSPSGYTKEVAEYVLGEYRALGYEPKLTVKGGVLVALGGKNKEDAVMLEAHIDTLGAIVTEIKSNGRLKVSPIGGMNANNAEAENCRVATRFSGTFEGTCQLSNASVHVNGDYSDTKRSWDEMEIVLDEKADSREETEKLGIMAGDFVCFDPRTTVTKTGYIKSRFLDDKLSVGILLGYAKYLKEENITTERMVYQHITVYEEVGHGGAASIPEGVTEVISVDMGCVGDGLSCKETQVSICAKDSRGPYNYDVVTGLIKAAKDNDLDFAVDVYPYYGSDADVALTAGYDVRHGLIGAGVYASHGYERSHKDGVKNTFGLLRAYLG